MTYQQLSDGIFDMRQDLELTLEEMQGRLDSMGLQIPLWTLQEMEDVNEEFDISLYYDVFDAMELMLDIRDRG